MNQSIRNPTDSESDVASRMPREVRLDSEIPIRKDRFSESTDRRLLQSLLSLPLPFDIRGGCRVRG